MKIRQRMLPPGWYPQEAAQVTTQLAAWDQADSIDHPAGYSESPVSAVAAIAPHAGWYFSGHLAWRAWKSAQNSDIVVIAGGHIPPGTAFRIIVEDAIAVPSGFITVEKSLASAVAHEFSAVQETGADNTVEVQLPFCSCKFPGIPVLAVRIPNDERAVEAGTFLAAWAREHQKRLFVLGSTDLTHYGESYGFLPGGEGQAGIDWAKKNDAAITEAFAEMDFKESLRLANEGQAACSVGAALCAMSFARQSGIEAGIVLGSDTSYRLHPSDSFVGYAALAY